MSAETQVAPTQAHKSRTFRRRLVGRVVSNKMDKTVVVQCVRSHRDTLYGKYVRTRAKYKAHDATNAYNIGDEVEIEEHRPLSKQKRWVVVRLIKKFVET